MARTLKAKSEDQLVNAGKAVIKHHFDNHEFCGIWCPWKRQMAQQLSASTRYYRCKTKDAKLYQVLLDKISRFITLDRLKEIAHSMDTQANE
jgi:hypothetical protein